MKLSDGTVTPTMLYGCTTWIMTKQLERRVRGVQRKMLRTMLGSGRSRIETEEQSIESWVSWVKRVTHEAEERMKNFNIEDWTTTSRRRKYRWCAKIATLDSKRWAKLAAKWDPEHSIFQGEVSSRNAGRPSLRWDDDINYFCQHSLKKNGNWTSESQHVDAWLAEEDTFVQDGWPETARTARTRNRGSIHSSPPMGQESLI